jgi:carbon-monoxide dehydrogenase medium subunit
MKPAPFSYHRPESVADAVAMLASLEDAKILAGGQSLIAMMNFRYLAPEHIVDINRIPELTEIREEGDAIRFGAMVRQRDAMESPLVLARCPLLIEALENVGHIQTRNRGTIGGSLSHLDPSAEIPAVFSALDAVLHVKSERGTRDIAIADWSLGYMMPNLEPDELLIGITVPCWPEGHGHAFLELARRHGDFAMAGAGALMALHADGTIARVAVALAGVDVGPVRLQDLISNLVGQRPSEALFAEVSKSAKAVAGIDDVHAPAAYRKRLAVVYTRRALTKAHQRALEAGGNHG